MSNPSSNPIIINLRTRASIRRSIPRAKPGEADRISDVCEQAADEIERLERRVEELELELKEFKGTLATN